MTRERDIEAYLVKRVKEAGGEVRKVKWIGRRGAPDRVVFLRGLVAFVELKAPGQKPDKHQLREIGRLLDHRVTVVVLDSKNTIDEWVFFAGQQW